MRISRPERISLTQLEGEAANIVRQARVLSPYDTAVVQDIAGNLFDERKILSCIPVSFGLMSPKTEQKLGVLSGAMTTITWDRDRAVSAQVDFGGTYLRMNGILREQSWRRMMESVELGWFIRHEMYHIYQSVHFPSTARTMERQMEHAINLSEVGELWKRSKFEEDAECYAYGRMWENADPLEKILLFVYAKKRFWKLF